MIIKGFIKENTSSETCLIWGRYRFGIRVRLRFFLWDMEYGVKILEKLVSEEWGVLWYPWRFATLVMSAYLTHILLVYSSLLYGSIQCVYSLISSIRFEGDFEQQVKDVPMHLVCMAIWAIHLNGTSSFSWNCLFLGYKPLYSRRVARRVLISSV